MGKARYWQRQVAGAHAKGHGERRQTRVGSLARVDLPRQDAVAKDIRPVRVRQALPNARVNKE